MRGLSQYLALVEKDAECRIDPTDCRLVEWVLIITGGDKLDEDIRVFVLERVVYQLGEGVPVIRRLGGDGNTETPVSLFPKPSVRRQVVAG